MRLRTAGGAAMVRRYGARAILDALYDGVLCEEPVMDIEPYVNEYGVQKTREVEVGGRRFPAPELRSPGGYLRWLLQQDDER